MNLSDLDPDIFIQAAESLMAQHDALVSWHSQYTCNIIDTVLREKGWTHSLARQYRKFYQDLYDIASPGKPYTMRDGILWGLQPSDAVDDATAYPVRLLALCFAAAVLEWEQAEAVEYDIHPDYSLPDDGTEHLYT